MRTHHPASGEHREPQHGQTLIRTIRRLLRRHAHAMQLYTTVLETTDDLEVQHILQHIIEEEREHHRDFQNLLAYATQHEQPHGTIVSKTMRKKAA